MGSAASVERRQAATDLLGQSDSRPGIEGTAYDTAWVASLPSMTDRRQARFQAPLRWLVEHQHRDGSWGGEIPYQHDRILSTLAALPALKLFGRRESDLAAVEAGTRYLWQHSHLLTSEPIELVGFEVLLPTLVERARSAGIPVAPHLDVYATKREEKLRLIPDQAIYSPRTTIVHSFEFLGDAVNRERIRAAQGANGAIGNSPAATAYFLSHVTDGRATDYLENCLDRTGGAMVPVLHPCETFELLWAAYHLHLAGVPASDLLQPDERSGLVTALREGGVSLSPTFPIPDADDTAVALLLLHDLGERVDPTVLRGFERPGSHFVSFPFERHGSVGVNLHVLHALLRVPGYPDQKSVVARLVDYLRGELNGPYWIDKWHISPYYATAHALCVLEELPEDLGSQVQPLLNASREWIRQTQNPDGSWGFYGRATAEETAYALLALSAVRPDDVNWEDRQRCDRAARYLRAALASHQSFPPLWIDKCLYTPTLVVRSVIEAALMTHARSAGTRLTVRLLKLTDSFHPRLNPPLSIGGNTD